MNGRVGGATILADQMQIFNRQVAWRVCVLREIDRLPFPPAPPVPPPSCLQLVSTTPPPPLSFSVFILILLPAFEK